MNHKNTIIFFDLKWIILFFYKIRKTGQPSNHKRKAPTNKSLISQNFSHKHSTNYSFAFPIKPLPHAVLCSTLYCNNLFYLNLIPNLSASHDAFNIVSCFKTMQSYAIFLKAACLFFLIYVKEYPEKIRCDM